jgi:hypothetical protein
MEKPTVIYNKISDTKFQILTDQSVEFNLFHNGSKVATVEPPVNHTFVLVVPVVEQSDFFKGNQHVEFETMDSALQTFKF